LIVDRGAGEVVVVDWGTTSFRAWLVEVGNGRCLDEIPTGHGMRALTQQDFPTYCQAMLSRWRDDPGRPRPPVYMAGMVGSSLGWLTAPQPRLPMGAEGLVEHAVAAPGMADAWIIPGLRLQDSATDRIDVMRGEEVQIFGALWLAGRRDAVLCLPGTHAKWARVEEGMLVDFATSVTGELYQAVLDHTILGRPVDHGAPWSETAFRLGLDVAKRSGGLLNHLFTARSRHLYGGLGPEAIASYLSGLLIGHELKAMGDRYPASDDVLLVGAEALHRQYETALATFGRKYRWIAGPDATIAGVVEVVRKHRPRIG
jgi:2-dehydro-3-deoxygalactonokinase